MEYGMALNVLNQLIAAGRGDQDAEMLTNALIKSAVRYARLRTDWWLADRQNRIRMDRERTRSHDAFIGGCNGLARHLTTMNRDVGWRDALTDDRKEIGDFACHVHAILGIRAR